MDRQRKEAEPHHADVSDAERPCADCFRRIVAVGAEQDGILGHQPQPEEGPAKDEKGEGDFEEIDHGAWWGV